MEDKLPFITTYANFESKGVKEDGKFHVLGYVATTDQDSENDIFTKNCIQSIVKQINSGKIEVAALSGKSFKANLDHEHLTEDSRIIPRGKALKATYEEKGAWAGALIDTILNPHRTDYKELAGSIADGFIDSYSIEFKATDFTGTKGKDRVINDVVVGGMAFTGRPVNSAATFKEFGMKSLVALESLEKEKEEELKMAEETIAAEKAVEEVKTELDAKTEEVEVLKADVEGKSKLIEEMKAKLESIEKSIMLKEEIKSIVKDELKSIQPEKKALAEANEEKLESKSKSVEYSFVNDFKARYGGRV